MRVIKKKNAPRFLGASGKISDLKNIVLAVIKLALLLLG